MRVTWDEVRAHWRAAEEEIWRPHYTERGFASWEAWRMTYVAKARPEVREWTLTDVADPAREVPGWHIGGYQGWKRYRPLGEACTTFATVAASPLLLENAKVQQLVETLHETTCIAVRCGSDVAVIDGTHRAAALAYRALHSLPVPACRVYMAELPITERQLFDAFCRDVPSLRCG